MGRESTIEINQLGDKIMSAHRTSIAKNELEVLKAKARMLDSLVLKLQAVQAGDTVGITLPNRGVDITLNGADKTILVW